MNYFPKMILILIAVLGTSISATWYSVNGKWARVEFQKPYGALADTLLQMAECELPRLAALHGLALTGLSKQKVRIIVTNAPDVSNGMALGHTVIIYTRSSMYMPFWTGTDSWYHTVLTHELAHYVTFLKIRRKFNVLGEAFNMSVPRWFFEGLAQYFAEDWNTYRGDLYLENALLAGKLNYASLENQTDGRLLYATGNAFIRYLASEYGDSSLIRLLDYKSKGWYLDFKKAFIFTYGRSPSDLFSDFTRQMVLYYGSRLADLPQANFLKPLAAFGYNDFQFIPFSAQDSSWLVLTQMKKNRLFKSAWLVKQVPKGFKRQKLISNHINTELILSPDKRQLAFGRYHLGNSENQLHIGMDWFIYYFDSGSMNKIASDIRARSAAFTTNNDLVLLEVSAQESKFVRYSLNQNKKLLFKTELACGNFIIPDSQSIIAAIQRKNGMRDLFLFKDGQQAALSNDSTDDRRPLLLNDSTLIFNRYQNGRPGLAALNLNHSNHQMLLNDRYAYFLQGLAFGSNSVLLSRWDANRHHKFFILNIDSLRHSKPVHKIKFTHPHLGRWIRFSAKAEPCSKKNLGGKSIKRRIMPQFPMEHLLTFALPTWDGQAGWGLYGITSWIEAMQRQALAAVFLLNQDYDQSLISLQHLLKVFNAQLLTSYYHGPVVFGFENGKYLNIIQDIVALEWQYQWFINGNSRSRLHTSLSYARYAHSRIKNPFSDYSYHGPTLRLAYKYLLPTRAYPVLPARQFGLSASVFKSLEQRYNFSIIDLSLRLASNLFWEELGVKTHTVYLKQMGNLPPYKTLGVDRFYELDLPRDFIYSYPLRGLRADISGKELLWNSTELVYLIAAHTAYKLINMPINNLALSIFADMARIQNKSAELVFSYGGELSFGESILRLGIGYARVKDQQNTYSNQTYGRLSLILP